MTDENEKLNKIINHIETMRLDAEQREQRLIEEAKDDKDLAEYFKGVKNACRAIEIYIQRHMTVEDEERSNV